MIKFLGQQFYYFLKASYLALVDLINNDGVEHAGYMAFLSMLSFFPFAVFLISFAGFIGDSSIGIKLMNNIILGLPEEVKQTIGPRIVEITSGPPQSLLTISIIGVIWTASAIVEGMRTILNRTHQVISPPSYIKRRLSSILQFIFLTMLIMVSMVLFVLIPWVIDNFLDLFNHNISDYHNMIDYISNIALILVFIFVVSYLYYTVPNVHLSISAIMPGTFTTVAGWTVLGKLITLYIHSFKQVSIVYGSLAGIIATLLFFYIANLIFIYGASLNHRLNEIN